MKTKHLINAVLFVYIAGIFVFCADTANNNKEGKETDSITLLSEEYKNEKNKKEDIARLFAGSMINPTTKELGKTFIGQFVYAKQLMDKSVWLGFKTMDNKQIAFSFFDESIDKLIFLSDQNDANSEMLNKYCKISLLEVPLPDGNGVATKVTEIEILDNNKKIFSTGKITGKFVNMYRKGSTYFQIKKKSGDNVSFIVNIADDETINKIRENPAEYKNKDITANWQEVERFVLKTQKLERVKELISLEIIPPKNIDPGDVLEKYIKRLNIGQFKKAISMIMEDKRIPYDEFIGWADRRMTKNRTIKDISITGKESLEIPSPDPNIIIEEGVVVSVKIVFVDGSSQNEDIALAKIKGEWKIAE